MSSIYTEGPAGDVSLSLVAAAGRFARSSSHQSRFTRPSGELMSRLLHAYICQRARCRFSTSSFLFVQTSRPRGQYVRASVFESSRFYRSAGFVLRVSSDGNQECQMQSISENDSIYFRRDLYARFPFCHNCSDVNGNYFCIA